MEIRRQRAAARGEVLPVEEELSFGRVIYLLTPIAILIAVVMGGIYGGVYTPTEAGAAGALGALVIALLRRRLTVARLWSVLVETGHVTASILFLIITASLYSRMLGVSGLPTALSHWIESLDASLLVLLVLYVLIAIILGTLIDSVSIMLITVPLFIILLKPFDVDLVWFGVVTVIAVEIGLLTPPFGLAVFAIKSTIGEMPISLKDIFLGAAPFAATMFIVLIIIMVFPQISLYLVQLKF
ncbi:MAG: TRAP transporter large permease subunit [Alphaproteobacteria bacterium]|nr:TRAP transporter large permease subunit [Alphaproteobacteria bacterium]